jgi:hypothetical protein
VTKNSVQVLHFFASDAKVAFSLSFHVWKINIVLQKKLQKLPAIHGSAHGVIKYSRVWQ